MRPMNNLCSGLRPAAESNLEASRHRVAGVDGEIQQRIFQQITVQEHACRLRPEVDFEENVLAQRTIQERVGVPDQFVQVDHRGMQCLAPRKGQEIPRQFSAPHDRSRRGIDELQGFPIARQAIARQLKIAGDDGQEIVEIMRNATV